MARMTRTRVTATASPAEDYDESGLDEFNATQDGKPVVVKTRMRRPSGPIASGWGAPAQQKRETVKAPYLRVDSTKKIIKLLEDEPAVRFRQHYVKPLNKFFTCIEVYNGKDDADNVDCPLCDAGHKPSQKYMMNVIEMVEESDEDYVTKTWTFGPEVAGHLQSIAEDISDNPRIPDEEKDLSSPRWYFKVYQVKAENNRISNKVEKISASVLADESGMEPLNEEELAEIGETMYGEETIWITSEDKLREAAKSV